MDTVSVTTKRTPIRRDTAGGRITERAIGLWIMMQMLPDCICLPQNPSYTQGPCRHCAKWYDHHAELHTELQGKLWQWPIVTRRDARAAGSQMEPDDQMLVELMLALDEAAKRRLRVAT
jgi:hypothetical protein